MVFLLYAIEIAVFATVAVIAALHFYRAARASPQRRQLTGSSGRAIMPLIWLAAAAGIALATVAIAADNFPIPLGNEAYRTERRVVFLFYAIDIAASAAVAAIAALHFYWAAGGLWPAASPRQLIDTVIGDPSRNAMPPAWLTASIGAALAVAAMLPLMIAPPFWWLYYLLNLPHSVLWGALAATFCVGTVFVARGIVGYLPFWRRLHPAEPFATLDAHLYSPLCLALGLAFLLLDFVAALVIAAI